jgi:hypothetical protein
MVFPLLSLSLLVFAVPRAGYWCSTWNQKAGRVLEAPQKPGVQTGLHRLGHHQRMQCRHQMLPPPLQMRVT